MRISEEELIAKLTEDGEYANDICLLLSLDDDKHYFYYLDYLEIRGKDLETFSYKCIPNLDIDYLKQTIRFLCSGFLGKDEIKENLRSNEPVYFIDKLMEVGDYIEREYEGYAYRFRCKLNNNKKR